jgi:ATP-dependent Clp protease protease subunit
MSDDDVCRDVPEYVHEAKAKALLAEEQRLLAETRSVLAFAAQSEIELLQRQRTEAELLTSDRFHNVYRYTDTVDNNSVKKVIEQFETWSRLHKGDKPLPVELVIYSPGGTIVAGNALYDYFTEWKERPGHHLTTTARGYAASMGGILLQAGHVRNMGAESWLLIHEGSGGAIGSVGEIEDMVEWSKKLRDHLARILAERSTMTVTQIKRKWNRTDWWLDANEALELGFIDFIV